MRRLLRQHPYDDIALRHRGRLDDFISFLFQSGILFLFDHIHSSLKRTPDIPRPFLHYALALRPLLEIAGANQIPSKLFGDPTTLRELGFSFEEITQGFSRRNKRKVNLPYHKDALYDELRRVSPQEWKKLLWGEVILLSEKGFLGRRDGVFALDACKLKVSGSYQGMGKKEWVEESLTRSGEVKRKKVVEKGYKLVILQRVTPERIYVVAACLIPLNRHELKVAFKVVKKAQDILPPGTIKLLLMDRAFMDGAFFGQLKGLGIDFIIPTKEDMDITEDMRGLLRGGEGVRAIAQDDTLLAGFSDLKTLSSYPYSLRGVLVLASPKKRKKIIPGQEWGYLTSLPCRQERQVRKVHESYQRRWTIENSGFKELKQGWYLNRFPGRTLKAVYAHIFLTLTMFNAWIAFRSKKGLAFTERGIRALRSKHFQPTDEVLLYVEGYVGIFSFSEFLELMNLPPPGKLKNIRIRHIFPPGKLSF